MLWHAYPVIGIDDRNQFDYYRDVPGIRELVADLQARGLRVFVNYNPWDVGTRREPVADDLAIAELVRELGVDGVFLDTMKEAQPGLRAALDARQGRGSRSRASRRCRSRAPSTTTSPGRSGSRTATVPGVLRARWFEQRHMLHHTRRWNRDHTEELHSAWLNGVGMLVWENVFGAWVGWNERDKELLRAMRPVQRQYAELLATGEWTPLAAASPDTSVVASRWSDGETTLWTVANRGGDYAGPVGELEVELPAQRDRGVPRAPSELDGRRRRRPGLPGARSGTRAPRRSFASTPPPDGFVAVEPRPLTAVFRRRETGTYGEAPYVEEWKPLPPRLHDFVEVERPAPRGRFAIGVREVADESGAPLTGLDLAEARAHAAAAGARLPTEDEWQLAAEAGLLERLEPLVWNWTESEHSDGRTRFAILKGGSDWLPEGSDWYVDGGPQDASYSLKLLLLGAGHGAVASDRLPAGGRPAVSETPQMPLEGIKVVEAATLFAAPLAAMMLGDYGADVIKIEHPHRVDPARGHGPSKDGIGLWFKALARNKRLVTLDLSKPAGRRHLPAPRRALRRRARELPSRHARALGRRLGRALGGESRGSCSRASAASARPARTPSRAGFGTLAEAMSGFAVLNGEPDGRRCSRRSRSRTASRRSRPRSRSWPRCGRASRPVAARSSTPRWSSRC